MNAKPIDIDVYEYLTTLGIRNVTNQGKETVFSCPMSGHRHADNNPSASMNNTTTAWICFGCSRRGNAITFLAELEGVSNALAARWIREKFGGAFQELGEGGMTSEIDAWVASMQEAMTVETVTNPDIGEGWISRYAINWEMVVESPEEAGEGLCYMLDRGFSPEILDQFEIGYDFIDDRVMIPVRNLDGAPIGIKGRAVGPNRVPRYRVLGGGNFPFQPYQTAKVLFGAHDVVPDAKGRVILCEGELNAVRMRQWGYSNAVSISGSSTSEEQARIVRKIANGVILYFDSDEAGKAGMLRAIELLAPFMPTMVVADHEKDAAASTEAEVRELMGKQMSWFEYSFIKA